MERKQKERLRNQTYFYKILHHQKIPSQLCSQAQKLKVCIVKIPTYLYKYDYAGNKINFIKIKI